METLARGRRKKKELQLCCTSYRLIYIPSSYATAISAFERETEGQGYFAYLGITAREWMVKKINRKIARADANSLPFGTRSQCERQKKFDREVLGA